MLVSADPVTGVVEQIGRYAMCVSANDVATSGNRPQFAECVVLLPPGSGSGDVEEIAMQLHSEAKRLRMAIVGGHTEVTPGLVHPIVMVTAFGFARRFVSSRDAKEGDSVMLTKSAGLEGTAVLGGPKKFLDKLSVVEEAAAAFGTGYVHAMHDCTEGGVLGALFEMSLASGLGFKVYERDVPVAPETRVVCRKFGVDAMKLIGSGALLLAVKAGREDQVRKALAPICPARTIGKFTAKGRTLVNVKGQNVHVRAAPEDELWRVLSRATGRGHRA